MRILFLSAWYPEPPDNGAKIRVSNMIRSLAERHELTLLSFIRSGDEASSDVPEGRSWSMQTVDWQPYKPMGLKSVLAHFSPVPSSIADTFSPMMARRVREITSRQAFDVVIASTIEMARYALGILNTAHVLEEHNFTTRIMHEQYLAQSNPVLRLRYWLTWAKYHRYEENLYSHFDAITMVSDVDAQAVQTAFPRAPRVQVIPNGLDLRLYDWDAIIAPPCAAIFTGSLTYSANLDAVRFLLSEVWNRVRSALPEARLRITGHYQGAITDEIAGCEGVELSGYLDDVHRAVRESAVCLVPIRVGGGTRFKILEAMALGTPVVSTSKGAEGLHVTHGKDILIADDPAGFAAHVVDVLEHPDSYVGLRKAARKLVESEYDWNRISIQFEALIQNAVSRRIR